jgi:hypothetical protein
MAAKKKAKKQQPKSAQAARNKKTPMKKAIKKRIALKGPPSKKMSASKAAQKKVVGKKKIALKGEVSKREYASKAAHKKVAGKKSKLTRRKPFRETSEPAETVGFSAKGPTANEGGQSGDLQGLSNLEGADSESVVELLEEGNAFEAAVVAGVENADNTEPSEVRTHEVLENDVPPEYLDRE